MKLGTAEPENTPVILFADEPDVARAIAAHTVYGGPVRFDLTVTRREEHGPGVVFKCQLGDGEPFTGRQRRDGQNLDRTVASPSGDQPLRKRTLSSIREATGQTSSKTAAEFP
jgi:hypothetical protein